MLNLIMENNIINKSEVSSEEPVATKTGRLKKTFTIFFCAILLISLSTVAGYYFGNRGNKMLDRSDSVSNVKQDSTNNTPNKDEEPKTHFITDKGRPFDLKKEVMVKLGLPSSVQGVQLSSNNNNRGYEQFLTDKYNDEIGRWTIGYPDRPPSGDDQISILAVGDSWLKATQNVDGQFFIGGNINTPAQKSAFLADLKTATQACAQDVNKGFALKDRTMNVCHEVTKSKYGEDGMLSLKGYGLIEGRQIVLFGIVELPDTKPETVKQWVSSLSETTILVKF